MEAAAAFVLEASDKALIGGVVVVFPTADSLLLVGDNEGDSAGGNGGAGGTDDGDDGEWSLVFDVLLRNSNTC